MEAMKSNQTTMTIDTRESDSRQHTRRRQAVRPESNVRTRRTNRFTPSEIKHFEAKLLAKRDEVLRTLSEIEHEMSGADTIGMEPMDSADRASLSHTIEEDSGLLGCERRVLEEIQQALSRIQDGTYGRCQRCMKPIPKRRLQAIPWANCCVPCANEKPIPKQETDEIEKKRWAEQYAHRLQGLFEQWLRAHGVDSREFYDFEAKELSAYYDDPLRRSLIESLC